MIYVTTFGSRRAVSSAVIGKPAALRSDTVASSQRRATLAWERGRERRGREMVTVRLHVQKDGSVWALCKCSACKQVSKYGIREAVVAPIQCRCGHKMDIKGAVIEAVDRMPGSPEVVAEAATRHFLDHFSYG